LSKMLAASSLFQALGGGWNPEAVKVAEQPPVGIQAVVPLGTQPPLQRQVSPERVGETVQPQ
jgi:hypothetical protein